MLSFSGCGALNLLLAFELGVTAVGFSEAMVVFDCAICNYIGLDGPSVSLPLD